MSEKNKKIVFVWIGMVWASGLYSCILQNVAKEYVIIDIFTDFAQGQKLDLEDALASTDLSAKVSVWDYSDCSDADVIVISAWRPQKTGETRLEMLQDNVKIMREISENIKNSGFSGISIIVSNPVDIMTQMYQESTGFNKNRVISSGCHLDTLRFKLELKKRGYEKIQNCYMIGEHGDSSVWIFWNLDIPDDEKGEIEKLVHKKAQEIITRKKVTHYGIWAIIAEISKAILDDSKKIFSVWKYLEWEFGQKWCYASLPCMIWEQGIVEACVNIQLSDREKQKFWESCNILRWEYAKIVHSKG